MMKLYRNEESRPADAIAAEFHDMILGYDRVVMTAQEAQRMFGEGTGLPVITNTEILVCSRRSPTPAGT